MGSHSLRRLFLRNHFPRKRQRMDEALFNSVAQGRIPVSENSGAAIHWFPTDMSKVGAYVPRGDCSLTTVKILSFFLGFLGVDHFFIRSPVTGLFKLFTLGGLGFWWLWDVIQLFTESDRVLNHGMSAPLDLVTGIGQGMITDKSFSYSTKAPYSSWIVGIIFGFIGIDSLLAKNGGQFLRKLLEFMMFIGSVIIIVNIWNGGLSTGAIVGIVLWSLIASFLGSIIIAEYISVMSVVVGGEMFTKGIEFTEAEDKQYNSFFAWLIKNAGFDEERQAEIVRDLQYGGIPANKLREMFEIRHPSEGTGTDSASKIKSDKTSSSWVSFFLLFCSPFLIIWNFILFIASIITQGVISITPWSPAVLAGKIAGAIAVDKAGLGSLAKELGLPNIPVDASKLGKLGDIANSMKSAGELTEKAKSTVSGGIGRAFGKANKSLKESVGQIGQRTVGYEDGLTDKVTSAAQSTGSAITGAVTSTGAAIGAAGKSVADSLNPVNKVLGGLKPASGLAGVLSSAAKTIGPAQAGGARAEPLSTEAQVFGAVTMALIGGGVIKGLVDYLITE